MSEARVDPISTLKDGQAGSKVCALCGLPLRFGNHAVVVAQQTLLFCCAGCKMVYRMLMEAADAPEPEQFKQTDLYRRCLAAGVVPADEEDLRRLNAEQPDTSPKEVSQGTGSFQLEKRFRVGGMWCPACAWVIQAMLEKTDGVLEAHCDFALDSLYCRYNPVKVAPEQIAAAVKQLGYDPADPEDSPAGQSQRKSFVRLIVSGILSANVMMLSWALYSGFFTSLNFHGVAFIGWPAAIMAAVVLIYGGGSAFRKAWYGLRSGAPGMEALIVLGAGSAYGYSLINLIQGSLHLYFDTTAMLVTLLLLGKMLEDQAKIKVREDLHGFLSLQPRKVRLCTAAYPDGRFTAIENLRTGDRFRVKADEIVPADGRILQGQASINAAAVTGEPKPRRIGPGDTIISGCRLLEGALIVEAVKTGRQTMLGQMIAIVQQSLSGKTVLESRTDRMLLFFVPAIAGLAVITGVVGYAWGLTPDAAIVRAVTVMVIACPCALGIAIPLARVAGIAGAGKRGWLVRDFTFFERMAGMDTVVFDKTGTITQGNWRLETIESLCNPSTEEIIAVVCGLESKSNHAVARAVREFARSRGIRPAEVVDVKSLPQGMSGIYQGQTVRVGSRVFVSGEAITQTPPPLPDDSATGLLLSQVYVGGAGGLWAVLKFGDSLRRGMPAFLEKLRHGMGPIHLISGDDPEAVGAVAAILDISYWQGRLLPQGKADYIKQLQKAGHHVLMVGDGINDAPALAQADLSVAVHSGSALAEEAAQVTLMGGSPDQLIALKHWTQRVDGKVRQNLWCAFGYNLISLPVAMSGLLTPLVAVSAMLLSSLTVIGNTLLLVRSRS